MATGKLTNNDIAKAIYLSTREQTGAPLTKKLQEITKFLARKRLLARSKDILESLNKIINKEGDTVLAKITSVEKLDHKIREELTQTLRKRYSAKEVILEDTVDKSLLGGIKIEVNDEVIDLSMKNKIKQLQEHLTAKI